MKKKKGFTLVELIISVVIVAILSIVSSVMYKGYVRKAKMAEGKVLLSSIADSLDVYLSDPDRNTSDNGYSITKTSQDSTLTIDARANKYFRDFKVENSTSNGEVIHKITVFDTSNTMTMIMTVNSGTSSDVSIKDNNNN